MQGITMSGITKDFLGKLALQDVDITFKKGTVHAIVGENGAGKSTLMNILSGALEPTAGEICLDSRPVQLRSPQDARACGIGMVYQHFMLVPTLKVWQNAIMGAEPTRRGCTIDKAAALAHIEETCRTYGIQLNPEQTVGSMTVGEQQRIEILKVLMRDAEYVILDEPTAVLTPQEANDLIDRLKGLKEKGKTIIVITHKLREVMEVSDSVVVIKRGKVVASMRTADTSEQELAQMMVGRDVMLTVENDRRKVSDGNIIYRAENLTTINGFGKECLKNVSFQVARGEILGIAGVEGNGQSELVKIISGLMEATAGKVTFDGEDLTNAWPDKLRQKGIGIIPEDRFAQGLCRTMTLAENAVAGYHTQKEVCKGGLMNAKAMRQRRDSQIERFDIRVGDLEGNVGALSGGNAQKIIVARELSAGPKLLIACQPTRGIDIGSIESIHRQLLEYRNQGNAVILISSELSEIMSLSDRVIVLYKGEVTGEVDPTKTDMMQIGLLMAGITDKEAAQ